MTTTNIDPNLNTLNPFFMFNMDLIIIENFLGGYTVYLCKLNSHFEVYLLRIPHLLRLSSPFKPHV